jgi:peptide deformylase
MLQHMKAILQEGEPILREKAKPVPEKMFGTAELATLIREMKAALNPEEDGVALAAPQVGIPYQIFIVRVDRTLPAPAEGEPPHAVEERVYINPEITKTSRRKAKMDEGCLSVRGVYGTTKRHERVTLKARAEDGARFTRGAGGLLAQIFEHETDHLKGILFIDHAEQLVHIRHSNEPALN